MTLLRCPKFLRCLTADAENFDRGHSLTSLPLPPAALSSLPTSARTQALLATIRRGGRLCPPAVPHFLQKTVIARPVRTLAVAIRTPVPKVLPPFTLHATQKSHRINPIRWLSLFHFCTEFSGRHWPFIIRTAACRASARCSAICARFTSRSALCSASRSRARFSADWARGRSMSSARSAARTSSVTSL